MHSTNGLARRRFLKTAAAAGCMTAASVVFGLSIRSGKSNAFRLVSETVRQRILEAGAKYVSQTPLTITAFPAKRSAGGLHDFYSQADYFWPNPKDPNGPYINRDGQSNPENFDEHRKVMVALFFTVYMPGTSKTTKVQVDGTNSSPNCATAKPNCIPSNLLDTTAANIMTKYAPLPTNTTNNSYSGFFTGPTNENEYLGKYDQAFLRRTGLPSATST
jgi:hypothetical protein